MQGKVSYVRDVAYGPFVYFRLHPLQVIPNDYGYLIFLSINSLTLTFQASGGSGGVMVYGDVTSRHSQTSLHSRGSPATHKTSQSSLGSPATQQGVRGHRKQGMSLSKQLPVGTDVWDLKKRSRSLPRPLLGTRASKRRSHSSCPGKIWILWSLIKDAGIVLTEIKPMAYLLMGSPFRDPNRSSVGSRVKSRANYGDSFSGKWHHHDNSAMLLVTQSNLNIQMLGVWKSCYISKN